MERMGMKGIMGGEKREMIDIIDQEVSSETEIGIVTMMKKGRGEITREQGQDPFVEKDHMIGMDQNIDTDQEVDQDHHTVGIDIDDEWHNILVLFIFL